MRKNLGGEEDEDGGHPNDGSEEGGFDAGDRAYGRGLTVDAVEEEEVQVGIQNDEGGERSASAILDVEKEHEHGGDEQMILVNADVEGEIGQEPEQRRHENVLER